MTYTARARTNHKARYAQLINYITIHFVSLSFALSVENLLHIFCRSIFSHNSRVQGVFRFSFLQNDI